MASDNIKRASAKDRVAETATSLQDRAVGLAADAAAGAKDVAASASDAVGGLYDKATEQAKDVLSSMPSSRSEAEHLALRGRQHVEHRVRRQPVEALLLAGAIGYLVGWATSRG